MGIKGIFSSYIKTPKFHFLFANSGNNFCFPVNIKEKSCLVFVLFVCFLTLLINPFKY